MLDGTALGLVHRDIGAQNLMIDSQGYLKVIDFGIAKSTVQTEFTLPGLIKGKLSYLAPDVFKFKDIDGRVDLYALGLVLYELVTMKRPYSFSSETTMAEILNTILQDPIRPPTGINPSVLPDLEKIIYTATDKDRDRRYQTGEDFARALYDFSNKHEGIATTLEVKNWYQTEFKQRIEQRHRFEQQVQEKANRIKKKTTNSGIIAIPPTMAAESKSKSTFTPEQKLPVQPAEPIIISNKHKSSYLFLAAAFLVLIGVIVLVYQIFFKSHPGEKEITLTPSAVQSPTLQAPSQPKSPPPADVKPKQTAISGAPAPAAPNPVSVPAPSPGPASVPAAAPLPSATPINPPAAAVDHDSKVAFVGKPAVLPKAAAEPSKAHATVVKKPIHQPTSRKRPTNRTGDTDVEYIDDTQSLKEGETASAQAGAISSPLNPSSSAQPEKNQTDSTVATAEIDRSATPIEKPVAPSGGKHPSSQSENETKKQVAAATTNLVSGDGNWSGEQVAAKGCTHCHPIDWGKRTKSQWQHFLSRGLHNKTRDLSLYFSKSELSRLMGFISSKEEETKQPKGIAGTH